MDEGSSSLHETTGKSSTSESHGSSSDNHGVKSKSMLKEPLLDKDKDEPAILEVNESPETVQMPESEHDGLASRFLPDFNIYQNKKTAGTGLMDFALLITNVNQLRHILNTFERNPYSYISITLVSISIILQIIVGGFLVLNSRYDVKEADDLCKADRVNNWVTALIFLITAINVILSAFEFPDMAL